MAAGIGQAVQAGVSAASQGYGDRASRRFQERQSALDQINDYRQFIARMRAEDPGKFLRKLAGGRAHRAGSQNLTVRGSGGENEGKTLWQAHDREGRNILNQLANPETYGLSRDPNDINAPLQYTAPSFSPAVSERYRPHIGGFIADGQGQAFGQGSAGFRPTVTPSAPGPGPAAPPPQRPIPTTPLPTSGFTRNWQAPGS